MNARNFLIIASFPDSIASFRGSLIASLITAGFDVHIAAPDLHLSPKASSDLIELGASLHDIPLQRTGTNPGRDLRTLFALLVLMIKLRPGFVFCYTIKPTIYGTISAWLTFIQKRVVLITGLGYAFQDSKDRSRLRRTVQRLYRLALSKSHVVFFQNPDDQWLFYHLKLLSPLTPSFVLNGSGVDTQTYREAPIPSGAIRFLLIARLLGAKGVREYAQAARALKRDYPEVQCSLAGWIDSNPDSISKTELDCWVKEGAIRFLGHLDDVRPAIADCCVYVLPSYREGTPRTTLEAMAMGRPVITTDAPGCRETVLDGQNGFLVPVKCVASLHSAMLNFVEDPTLVESMGRLSRQIAVDRYDVHKVNEALLRGMKISRNVL